MCVHGIYNMYSNLGLCCVFEIEGPILVRVHGIYNITLYLGLCCVFEIEGEINVYGGFKTCTLILERAVPLKRK